MCSRDSGRVLDASGAVQGTDEALHAGGGGRYVGESRREGVEQARRGIFFFARLNIVEQVW